MGTFEINLNQKELKKRTSPSHFRTYQLIDEDNILYQKLATGDKQALPYLIEVARLVEEINYHLDHPMNMPFLAYLESAPKTPEILMTQQLFEGQKGINAIDAESNIVSLLKKYPSVIQMGFYPLDLEKEEFHQILIEMLSKGKDTIVQKILNQRTIVKRAGEYLQAIDYVDAFPQQCKKIAFCLNKAAEYSTHPLFNEFLRLQAKAFTKADLLLDAEADKVWARLQDTPLELTITRECYHDKMTPSVLENDVLKKMLFDRNIPVLAKDNLGARVGLVNPVGTKRILEIQKHLPLLAQQMPFKELYSQPTSFKNVNQTMVDVDLICLSGNIGEYRGSVALAQNLPNGDKLSVQQGGGHRNVYHRQIRQKALDFCTQHFLDSILDPTQHTLFNPDVEHLFTIGHENAHSLGPLKQQHSLGKYHQIIEENKADMASLSFVDTLTAVGFYTAEQRLQLLVTIPLSDIPKAKPPLSKAHRVRATMQLHYFIKNKAIEVLPNDILRVNIEKIVPTAQKMLKEIIQIQLSGDIQKAEKYVSENFVWDEQMERISQKVRKENTIQNGGIHAPLVKKINNSVLLYPLVKKEHIHD